MISATRICAPYFRSWKKTLSWTALSGALLLGGCQPQDGLGDKAGKRPDDNLSNALAIPPAKFADGVAAQGFNTPMAMEFAPDGRLFVLEKSGAVKIAQGASPALTFLTLSVDQNTERGLLGIAFDPEWPAKKYVYIHYSRPGANANRVSRFTVSATDTNKADPASEIALFFLSPLTNSAYHNGGALHFGKDGYLYVTTGDNRLPANAQNSSNLLGKILRFSKVPSGTEGTPIIPTDNPFYTTYTGNNRAIWGYGLRNPFTFAVQPGTGRIFVNDVGEDGYEEINDASAGGRNFGWPANEGPTAAPGVAAPIGGYLNGTGVNGADCAITGAAFYNPPAGSQQFPSSYVGDFFFGDHCSQYIKSIDLASPTSATTFATSLGGNLMDLKVGPDGAVYYLTLNGLVGKISYTGTDAPTIARDPVSQTVSLGQSVTFSVEANGGGLSYQWKKGGANIAGAVGTSHSFTPVLADNGTSYQVIVSNAFGTRTSAAATLTVITNQPPAPVITTPLAGATYIGGQAISFSGTGSDPEDGPSLPASALTWRVDLHHDTHAHTFIPDTTGVTGGTFTIPTVGEASPNVWYRIYLTVKDSKGLTATVSRDILPVTTTLTVTTSPSGLQFLLDDQPKTSPFTFTGVVGIARTLEAVSPQSLAGVNYRFDSWSNGQAAKHTILTPAVNTQYTATFVNASVAINLPGRLQAEDYKAGGEGVGYHDLTTGNTGNVYRADNVDIEATADTGGGYNVGWQQASEWLAYDVKVAATGVYKLTARMASQAAGTKTAVLSVDGANVATFNLTDASGWQSWKDVVVNGVNLTAGNHVLRITMNTADFNLNYVNVSAASNLAPIANAGPDQTVLVNAPVTLDGRGSSDPDNGPQALSYAWTKVAGPADTLTNPNSAQPGFTPTAAGIYGYRLLVSDGAATDDDTILVTVNTGSPVISLPGRVQAEDYKAGGEGTGYHDLSAGNAGGAYRTDNVDIQATSDSGGGYNVGYIDATEWLAFNVNVTASGAYTLTARMASASAGTKTATVSVDGATVATFSFTDASGWQSWKDVIVSNVNLTAGNHTLRITMTTGGFNLNYLNVASQGLNGNADLAGLTLSAGPLSPAFAAATTSYAITVANGVSSTTVTPIVSAATSSVKVNGTTVASGSASAAIPLNVGANAITVAVTAQNGTVKTYTVTVTRNAIAMGISLPGRIQLEDYKAGGEGVGYHDLTAGNSGNVYRTDNVDIQVTTDSGGGFNVGWTAAAEWLAFDVNVTTAGTYSFTARLASQVAGTKAAVLTVDGVTAATFNFTDASGWQSWKNLTVTGINLTAGNHVLRLTLPNGGLNLNYIDAIKP